MLEQGTNLAPSKYEAWFLTVAHTEADIDARIEAAERAMGKFFKKKIAVSFYFRKKKLSAIFSTNFLSLKTRY